MRIAQLVVLEVPQLELVETDELPESERGERGFRSSRARDDEPSIRGSWGLSPGSASRRYCAGTTGCCSAGTRSPARSTGCCRAAASNTRESLVDALHRELCGGARDRRGRWRSRAPSAIVDSISPVQSFAAQARRAHHHLRGATSAGARSRKSSSQDAAVRGHRLFGLDDLDDVVLHPPIQRFVQRWRPGVTRGLPRSLWATIGGPAGAPGLVLLRLRSMVVRNVTNSAPCTFQTSAEVARSSSAEGGGAAPQIKGWGLDPRHGSAVSRGTCRAWAGGSGKVKAAAPGFRSAGGDCVGLRFELVRSGSERRGDRLFGGQSPARAASRRTTVASGATVRR